MDCNTAVIIRLETTNIDAMRRDSSRKPDVLSEADFVYALSMLSSVEREVLLKSISKTVVN